MFFSVVSSSMLHIRLYILALSLLFFGCKTQEKKTPVDKNEVAIQTEENPNQTLRINFIIIQKEDGSGNFEKENPEHQQLLHDLVSETNFIYSHLYQFEEGEECYVSNQYKDMGIRVQLENIYYVKNDYYWNNQNERNAYGCPDPYDRWYLKPLHEAIQDTIGDTTINLYFTNNACIYGDIVQHDSTCAQQLSKNQTWCSRICSTDTNYEAMIHIRNLFIKYQYMKNDIVGNDEFDNPDWKTVYRWLRKGEGSGLAHEIAHPFFQYNLHQFKCRHLMDPKSANNPAFFTPQQVQEAKKNLEITNMKKYLVK